MIKIRVVGLGKKIPELSSLLSSFTLRLNAAETVTACVGELEKVSENFFEIDWYSYISEVEKFGKVLDQETLDFAHWSSQKHHLSITPIGNSMVLFVPLFSRTKNLGVLVMGIKNDVSEITRGVIDVESFLAFETSMIIENMKLAKELVKKNKYVAEAKYYLENVLNSLKYAVVVEDIYRNEEFSNVPYRKLITDKTSLKPQIEEMVNNAFVYRKEISNEIEHDGSFYSVHVVPVELSSGLKVVASIQDITNTKELERLQKINRMKNDFVATVSHELKTPLSAILAYSETILDSADSLDSETLKQFVGTIKNEGEHLKSIVNDMLDFSKLESDSFPMNFKRVDLIKLIKESYKGLKARAQEKGIKFKLSLPEHLISAYVTADSRRMRQIIDNLVVNAFKYDDNSSPEVKISLLDAGENYIVEVYDNGSSVPEEERDKVFQKFYRIETMKAKASGTGLGLALVKEIVEKHRGKIWIEGDKNECAFKFLLPKKDWLTSPEP